MSISPISSYMMSMYVSNNTSVLNANKMDYEYIKIIQELASYGISSSGDKNVDKMKLETVKRQIEMMQTQNLTKTKQSIPFEDVMNTLNLTVTGDLDKDYETTIDKLDYEIGMAYTDEEKEYLEALKYQVETEYNTSKQDRISFSGTTMIADMNKFFMLGIS